MKKIPTDTEMLDYLQKLNFNDWPWTVSGWGLTDEIMISIETCAGEDVSGPSDIRELIAGMMKQLGPDVKEAMDARRRAGEDC